MKRILHPFQGLDDIQFGMPMREVQTLTGIATHSLKDNYLQQEQVTGDRINYIFESGVLVTIELLYQNDIWLNDVNVFNTREMEVLFPGQTIERRRNAMHIKTLGVILLGFHHQELDRRELWSYSRKMVKEFEGFLDVV